MTHTDTVVAVFQISKSIEKSSFVLHVYLHTGLKNPMPILDVFLLHSPNSQHLIGVEDTTSHMQEELFPFLQKI